MKIMISLIAAAALFSARYCCGETIRQPQVEEKIGRTLPDNLIFHDEYGNQIKIDQLLTKPSIFSLVYFSCGSACPLILGNLAEALSPPGPDPGKDYRVITISFDERDTPRRAAEQRKNYIPAAKNNFPENSWKFLSGDQNNIRALTEAVGFEYRKENNGFSHPKTLIFVSPERRIVRYLYGIRIRSFDIAMALREAGLGKSGLNTALLLFSYGYDRYEKKYVFNFFKVLFTVLLSAAAFVAIALILSRRGNRDGER